MLILVLLCCNSFAEAQLTKLRVGYSAISEVDMPAWVAKETKLFEKNGLDVQLIYFTDILEKTWELLTEGTLLPRKQYPTMEGIKFILAPLAEKDPKAKAAKPADFTDLGFIKALDESGYIDNLYRKK